MSSYFFRDYCRELRLAKMKSLIAEDTDLKEFFEESMRAEINFLEVRKKKIGVYK